MYRKLSALVVVLSLSCGGGAGTRPDNNGGDGGAGGDDEGGSGGASAGNTGTAGKGGKGGQPAGGEGGSVAGSSGGGSGGSAGAGSGGSGGESDKPDAAADGKSSGDGRPADMGTGGSTGTGGTTGGGKAFAYVGGYGTSNVTAYTLDVATGAMTKVGSVTSGTTPSWGAFSPDKKYFYSINEEINPSVVVSFSINQTTGALKLINKGPTMGDGAPFIAVHPSGNWVVAPHYNSGDVTVVAVKDGNVGAATDNKNGGKEAHSAWFDGTGNFLFVPFLGSNYIAQYKFQDGKITPNSPATVSRSGGPRHMAFSPNYDFAYVLTESSSTVTAYKVDKTAGTLSEIQSVAAAGKSGQSSHIVMHPSGKFLYASHRGESSIGILSVDPATGMVKLLETEKRMISTPRGFAVDPSGKMLVVANQGSGNLIPFKIDEATGKLTPTATVSTDAQPTFVGIMSP